jgi:Na+/proline symporter
MVHPNHDDDNDDRSGANMIVLIAVAVIIVIGVIVAWQMKKESSLKDCYAAGGRNCQPVNTSR